MSCIIRNMVVHSLIIMIWTLGVGRAQADEFNCGKVIVELSQSILDNDGLNTCKNLAQNGNFSAQFHLCTQSGMAGAKTYKKISKDYVFPSCQLLAANANSEPFARALAYVKLSDFYKGVYDDVTLGIVPIDLERSFHFCQLAA